MNAHPTPNTLHGRSISALDGASVSPELLDRVRGTLALTGAKPTPAHVAAALRADGTICGDAMVLAVVTALRREAPSTPCSPSQASPTSSSTAPMRST